MSKIEQKRAEARKCFEEAKALLAGEEKSAEEQERVEELMEQGRQLKAEAEQLAEIKASMSDLEADDNQPPAPETKDEINEAANVIRFGEIGGPEAKVMREVYAGDYRQKMYKQERAFTRYLRVGERGLSPDERNALRKQMWHPDEVTAMLKDGLSVAEVKATMIEGTDTLGGYAVPAERANEILARIPGLTAVRAGEALVIQTSSSMIEWLKVTGGGDRYPSAMRGSWGSEASPPTGDDFTLGLEQIPVHVYTYKVPFSQSLVEDASNLVEIFTDMVSTTLALDEDDAFLTGDGSGKPTGILPDSANGHSLTSPDTGDGSTLTMDGLKALKRGVASQYRAPGRASMIGNSDTGLVIEKLKDSNGRYFYESLDIGDTIMSASWRESEAMPDVAGSAFPLIYGDLSGYAIVERLGLSVVRFQDSNTGVNKVEFHVRRRIGGNVIEPWKLAVQEVTA